MAWHGRVVEVVIHGKYRNNVSDSKKDAEEARKKGRQERRSWSPRTTQRSSSPSPGSDGMKDAETARAPQRKCHHHATRDKNSQFSAQSAIELKSQKLAEAEPTSRRAGKRRRSPS